MRATPDAGSVSADESGLVGAPPSTPVAHSAIRSVQQPQLPPSGHEPEDDDTQLIDVAVHPEDPGSRAAAFVDDATTDQLLPSPSQLASASASEIQVELSPSCHEPEDNDTQLIDVRVQPEDPGLRATASVDDGPTGRWLPSPRQLGTTSEIQVELSPGSVLRSRYVLEDIIGRGGHSVLFRAKDLHRTLSQDTAANLLAIKLLRPAQFADPRALARLKREFQQMQGLLHPGIVRVFDFDCDGDIWFISMELVAGRTVKTWMETPVGHANALRIIAACGEALEYAHSLGILHGDLKPTNVMVTDDGTAKLIDFGSAPSPGSLLAARSDPGLAVTPLYASPQILAGKSAERRDDVYSLAHLSYHILSGGRHPFGGRPSLEDGRAKSAPNYVRAIPTGLFAVLERGLSAERERRPPSVREFLDDLTEADRRHRADLSSTSTPTSDNVGAMHYPVLVTHAADKASRLTSPAFFKKIRLKARAQPLLRLTALVFAIVGTAALYRVGTHRNVIRAPESPAEALIMSPELVATAPAQSEVLPQTRPLLHDSGVISFDASTIHASAAQSLVAISVKRLPAARSRGAFLWRVERGTAQPGVDYQQIQPQVVRFIEGQAVRTLFIPLINTAATLELRGPRTFTVALERVKGGPALGRFARVTVAIDPPPTSSPFGAYQARADQ